MDRRKISKSCVIRFQTLGYDIYSLDLNVGEIFLYFVLFFYFF